MEASLEHVCDVAGQRRGQLAARVDDGRDTVIGGANDVASRLQRTHPRDLHVLPRSRRVSQPGVFAQGHDEVGLGHLRVSIGLSPSVVARSRRMSVRLSVLRTLRSG